MELLKEAGEHKIFKKRSGKYAVQDKKGKFVNGQPKVEILLKAGVIKKLTPKKKEEAAAAAPSEG
jgi:hypothetical protein